MTRNLWQDVKYAGRMMAKTPGLSAIIILTLALGLGANTVIFSIVNDFLLRPMAAVPDGDRIAAIGELGKGAAPLGMDMLSYADLRDFQSQAGRAFSAIMGYQTDLVGLSFGDHAEQIIANDVSGNFFTGLELRPAVGRLFAAGEGEQAGAPREIVLAYDYWESRFGEDPRVVGKQVLLNGKAATIIGVAPRGFHGGAAFVGAQAFLPLSVLAEERGNSANFWTHRDWRSLRVLARLKPGVRFAQARSDAEVVQSRLAAQDPTTEKGLSLVVVPERLARPVIETSSVLPLIAALFVGLAAMVLLLACMNIANILLARSSVRQREMAIRAALGAPQFRLVRQMLIETILLSLAGGVAGAIWASWACAALSSMKMGTSLPIIFDLSFDWRVFAYALGIALLAGIAAGIWPAVRIGRANLNLVLHEGARGDSGRERHRVRSALVVAQVAGSLALLVAAGFFVRSLREAQRTYLGFDPNHLVTMSMDPSEVGYDQVRTKNFFEDLQRHVAALPGISAASESFGIPLGAFSDGASVYIEDRPLAPGQQPPMLLDNEVTPEYFATMRTPILRGRGFTRSDDEHAPPVAVINRTMARRFWPGENPIGKRFRVNCDTCPFIRVVGVAADGKYEVMMEQPQPFFYVPFAQKFRSLRTIEMRSSLPPTTLIPQVEREISSLAPSLPVFDAQPMEETLGGANGSFVYKLGVWLAGAMGLLGLIIAIVGVYGVVSYSAAQRTREVGIRIALGASSKDVLKLILRQGLVLIAFGVIAGLAAGYGLTRAMNHVFHGETGVLGFAIATALLVATGILACYLPARRAMRLDPTAALRHE